MVAKKSKPYCWTQKNAVCDIWAQKGPFLLGLVGTLSGFGPIKKSRLDPDSEVKTHGLFWDHAWTFLKRTFS